MSFMSQLRIQEMGSYLDLAIRIEEQIAKRESPSGRPETGPAKARRLLRQNGWVAVRSQVLDGEIILLSRDASIPVPTWFRNCARFETEEFPLLVGAGPEQLRLICETKRLFGGRLVTDPDADGSVEGCGGREGPRHLVPESAPKDAG